MLSNNTIKQLKSYHLRKFRLNDNIFIAETPKVVESFLASNFKCINLYATEDWNNSNNNTSCQPTIISDKELERISTLVSPNQVFAVFERPISKLNKSDIFNSCSIVLDNLNDPGNLGTIIRLCDWFGIKNLICSENSVDAFQPKCVQAAMGSHVNINIIYTDIKELLMEKPKDFKVYGTFLEGENIYKSVLKQNKAMYIIGNEANGISPEIELLTDEKIFIPNFSPNCCAESLNASMACAILCSEIRR